MNPKKPGACTQCDKDVFEVAHEDPVTGHRRLGRAHDEAVRVTFLLINGTRMDLTFCAECDADLVPADFSVIWKRVMASWIQESGRNHPNVKAQRDNAIAVRLGSKLWKEI